MNKPAPEKLTHWLKRCADNFEDRESLLVEAFEKFPGKSRNSILRRLTELYGYGIIKPKPPTSKSPKLGRRPKSLSGTSTPKTFTKAIKLKDVEEDIDDESKLEDGLKALGDTIIKDNDFRLELGISTNRWKAVTHQKKYETEKIELRGKQFRGTFWGQTKVLAGLRSKINKI